MISVNIISWSDAVPRTAEMLIVHLKCITRCNLKAFDFLSLFCTWPLINYRVTLISLHLIKHYGDSSKSHHLLKFFQGLSKTILMFRPMITYEFLFISQVNSKNSFVKLVVSVCKRFWQCRISWNNKANIVLHQIIHPRFWTTLRFLDGIILIKRFEFLMLKFCHCLEKSLRNPNFSIRPFRSFHTYICCSSWNLTQFFWKSLRWSL